jgi:hypothetical protein
MVFGPPIRPQPLTRIAAVSTPVHDCPPAGSRAAQKLLS